jgi:enoyl-CoA hydratase/carnithine racemase
MSEKDNEDGRIVTRRDGNVLVIGIDRPKKMNGWTPKMIEEYCAALTHFDRESDARCAVLYAEGPNFTAGLDLPRIAAIRATGRDVYPVDGLDIWNLRPPFRQKPLIVAVHGICFTVGVEISLSADIVVAAEGTRFNQMEVKRGIMAAGGATVRMAQSAGWGNAMRYLLTGDEWDTATALRFGWIQEVVPLGQQFDRAMQLARKIADEAAPLAVAATRVNVHLALTSGREAVLAHMAEARPRLFASEDAKEGVQSFREKRPARFSGR